MLETNNFSVVMSVYKGDNPLFFKENTRMLFGDAKESIGQIVREFT